MTDKTKKAEDEMALQGAVEMKEEDLDKASGGAAYCKIHAKPLADTSLTSTLSADKSLNFSAPTGVTVIGEEG